MSEYTAPVTRSRSGNKHGQSSSPETSVQALPPKAVEDEAAEQWTAQPVPPSPQSVQSQASAPITIETPAPGERGTGSLGLPDGSPQSLRPLSQEFRSIKRKGSLNLDEEHTTKAPSPEDQCRGMPLIEDILWESEEKSKEEDKFRDPHYLVKKILSVVDSETNSETKHRKLLKIAGYVGSAIHVEIIHDVETWISPTLLEILVGGLQTAVWHLARMCEAAASPEEANSAKYDVVKHVTTDFARYLTHPIICYPLFEAAIWDTVVAELFEVASAFWAGQVGMDLTRIIKQVEGPVERYGLDALAELQENRARLALSLTTAVWRPASQLNYDTAEHDTPETSAEKDRLVNEVFWKRFQSLFTDESQAKGAMRKVLDRAATLRRELEIQREEHKLVKSNGLDDKQHHFDFNPKYMNRHGDDRLTGPLDKERPAKVAFFVSPMLVKRGYCEGKLHITDHLDKTIRVWRSTVMLEDWQERWDRLVVSCEESGEAPESAGDTSDPVN